MLQRIARQEARLGMFVQALEGSWLQHPFWRRRFLLDDPADLAKLLESSVPSLIVDLERGNGPAPMPVALASDQIRPVRRPELSRGPRTQSPKVSLLDRSCSVAEERPRAERIMKRSGQAMKGLLDGVRLGRAIRSADVSGIVDDISSSVRRNPGALLGLSRLKGKDEYTYLHSVAVCALMVNFARHLGLPEDEVYDLGLAGLLHDVGKMTVPDGVLSKPGSLSEEEFAIIRTHPAKGHQLLLAGEAVPEAALDVCLHHHERPDGRGYPERLSGALLTRAARMGAICDVYDALTSNRAYKGAWQPAETVSRMHEWVGQFDRELLLKFMRSIGVYPPGLLVRLRSNRLGIVLENGRRASRPRVRAFMSTVDRTRLEPVEVIIDNDFASDQIVGEEDALLWGFGDWEAARADILA